MPTDKHLAKHDSQVSRLEQVMTALAEAQVKTEDEMGEFRRSMSTLAKGQARNEKAQAKTEAQFARTDAIMAQLGQTMNVLAEAQIKTAAEVSKLIAQTRALERQWEAYLNTLPKN